VLTAKKHSATEAAQHYEKNSYSRFLSKDWKPKRLENDAMPAGEAQTNDKPSAEQRLRN